ncbi:ADP-ribosylation factor-like protein 6-interacting protein 4 [Phlyctochytrium planicorne]|nr:ADP-ribosylation factor-like protein 6-interacting protein 4 [Phlyctochytrium planicorne]
MYSYRWQDGFVSPFVATDDEILHSIIQALDRMYSLEAPFAGVLDLGSGKGHVVNGLARACKKGQNLEGKGNGPFIGIELDESLVNESRKLAAKEELDDARFFVGDFVTREIKSESGLVDLESLSSTVSIIVLFLLPQAIGKIIPWLEKELLAGRVVISIRWDLSFSGNNLEAYRDAEASSDHNVKIYRRREDVYRKVMKEREEEIAAQRSTDTLVNNVTEDVKKGPVNKEIGEKSEKKEEKDEKEKKDKKKKKDKEKKKKEKKKRKEKKKGSSESKTLDFFNHLDSAMQVKPAGQPKEPANDDIIQGPMLFQSNAPKDLGREPTPINPNRAGRVAKVPQRFEEYQAEQSVIRRERDPYTGRMRLVKGTGEILEEIVSQEEQRRINKLATQGDGAHYSGIYGRVGGNL